MAGMTGVAWGLKNAEIAKRILEEQRGYLTKADVTYLLHVIEEGKRAQKIMDKWTAAREASARRRP